MRNSFDEQLAKLHDMLIEMGAMIEKAINLAIQAFLKQDAEPANRAISFDDDIDQMEKRIESLCLKLLLQQQPVASDLRMISAALKMITDMERIGDHAADISAIILLLIGNASFQGLDQLPQLAKATTKMVTESIDAYVKMDIKLAQAVIDYDDVVDELFQSAKDDLIEMIRRHSIDGELAIDLVMIAKYFEKIGDHATNIAEWVMFSITGSHYGGRSTYHAKNIYG